jgi:hypothetical protein
MVGKKNLSIRELSKELAECQDRSNRVVERFLFHLVTDRGLDCGKGCAGDIERYMKREGITFPNLKENAGSRLRFINRLLWDATQNQPKHFKIVEIDGNLRGLNFAWWYNGVDEPSNENIPDSIGNPNRFDADNPNVC